MLVLFQKSLQNKKPHNKSYWAFYGAGDGCLVNSFLSGKYFTSAKACRSICPHLIEFAHFIRLHSTEFTLEPENDIFWDILKSLTYSFDVMLSIKTILKLVLK